MMDAVLLSSLLFLRLLSGVTATELEIVCSPEPVKGACCGEAVLQCHLEPQQDVTLQTVKWTRGIDVVHLYKDGKDVPTEQREHFKGRTSLSNEGLTKGNLSLKLSPLELNDSGRYRCSFLSGTLEKNCSVNLTLEDPEVVGSHVPVTAVVGQNVILPCHLEPPCNVSNLRVEWKRKKMTTHSYRSRNDDPDPQDESYKGRTALFREEMAHGNISLKLMNVTENDAGNYTCFVRYQKSQARKGNINLKVVPKGVDEKRKDDPTAAPKEDGNNLSPTHIVLIVIGSITAIAAIAVIAVIYCVRKRKQQQQPRALRTILLKWFPCRNNPVHKGNQQQQPQSNEDPPAEEGLLQVQSST